MSSSLSVDAWSVRLRTSAPHRLVYSDAEIDAAIEGALDQLEGEDGVVAQFFAEGEALSKQHRLEAQAIEGSATVKPPWWRRFWRRSPLPDPA